MKAYTDCYGTSKGVKDMTPEEYLKKPYTRCFVPLPDGGFFSRILEFPGCISEYPYDDIEKAYMLLEQVASSWIAAALTQGQEIPEPEEK